MTALYLTRIDVTRNMLRFYKLVVQVDLFEGYSLIREYGRTVRPGTVRIERFATRGQADMALIANWARRRRRGYR
jgi:predicted DNA-binding WGR domain protein